MSSAPKQHPVWIRHLNGLLDFSSNYSESTLGRGKDGPQSLKLIRKLDLVADGEIANLLQSEAFRPGDKIACRAGCCYCCKQEVVVSTLEVIALYQHIQQNCSEAEAVGFRQAARDYHAGYRQYEDDRIDTTPCPLLVGGMCAVREVRPLACRGYFSFNLEACEDRWSSKRLNTIPVPIGLIQMAQGLTKGILKTLEKAELEEKVTLGLALNILFEEPNAIERYFAGEEVFSAAVPATREAPAAART
jgi:Fe-S-cluster containining protein